MAGAWKGRMPRHDEDRHESGADEQPAGGQGERRQVVAGALRDDEVRADADRRGEGEQRADQVERGAGDVDDEHESDDRDDRAPEHERGRRAARAHPDERDEHHRREVLDQQRDRHRHPLHRREEEELAAEHRHEPEPERCSRQCRRRKPGWRRIARKSAGERMSPATPMRTRSAAPSDQPASSSGLMNGPLDEKASADATAMTSPDVRALAGASDPMTGSDAVEVVMAASDCQE